MVQPLQGNSPSTSNSVVSDQHGIDRAQCAALLPCCLEPPLLESAIRCQTARGGTLEPLNSKRALLHHKQLGDGTPAPEEALAQLQPLLPSRTGTVPAFRSAMEVRCYMLVISQLRALNWLFNALSILAVPAGG